MRNILAPAEAASPSTWRRRRRNAALVTACQVLAAGGAAAAATFAAATWLPAGLPIVLGTVALVLAGVYLRRRQLANHARVEGLILAALVGVGAALALQVVRTPAPEAAARWDPNALAVARVLRAQRALQTAAGRTLRPGEAALPAASAFLAFLQAQPDGAGLLDNPWGGPVQAAPVQLGPTGPLRSAAALAQGAAATELRVPLGAGRRPADGPYTALTYGALVYDHDPVSGTYVLYGIGQAGEQAVVVHQATGTR